MSKNSSNNKLSKFLMNIIIAFGGALAIILILTFGNFWPSVKMNPKNLPIGIVSLDKGISHPQESNIGKSFVDKIRGSGSDAIEWKVYGNKDFAVNAANNKDIYAYIVIPSDFTSSLMDHISGSNSVPVIKTYVNEGMNYSGVSAAQNILNSVTAKMQSGIQTQMLSMAMQKGSAIPSNMIKNLQTPFTVETVKVHTIGEGGSGNIPMMLSVFLWMGSLISMLMIWRGTRKIENRKEAVLFQVLSGIIVSVVFSFIDLFIVENIMDLTIYNYWSLFEFAFIVGLSFYLLQSTILNWIGIKGWLILILIWLFGMPAVNLPVQFLNNFTKYAVYSWSPYRFSSEIFRDIMYYNSKADFSSMASIIIISGLVFFILLMLSMFKVNKNMNSDDRNEVSSEVY